MSLTVLIPKIKTTAEAIGALSALGTLYYDEDAPGAAAPYWKVFPYGIGKVDQSFGQRYIEIYPLQFDIYHSSLVTLGTYQDALHTNFDNAALTLTSGTCIQFRRMFDHIRQTTNMTDKDGNPVFQAISRYEAKVDKSF